MRMFSSNPAGLCLGKVFSSGSGGVHLDGVAYDFQRASIMLGAEPLTFFCPDLLLIGKAAFPADIEGFTFLFHLSYHECRASSLQN